MAVSDAKRFADALASDQKLFADVKPKVNGLASFVEIGNQHGYNFTIEDAKQLVRSKVSHQQLSDQQLDAIAGGDQVATHTNGVTVTLGVTTAVGSGTVAGEIAAVVAAVLI